MRHIEQQTLELYVLGDERVVRRRRAIERHLNQCLGCRLLKARMEELYVGLAEQMQQTEKEHESAIVRRLSQGNLPMRFVSTPLREVRASYEVDRSVVRTMTRFVARHPVGSSVTAIIAVILIVLSGNLITRKAEVNGNPVYYHYNVGESKLEVYNAGNRVLWSMPTPYAQDALQTEEVFKRTYTVVVDINGRGENDVVTTLPLGKAKHSYDVQVYDAKGNLTGSHSFKNDRVNFRQLHYDLPFFPSDLIPWQMPGGKMNLLVTASNGRSPNFIARLDSSLNVIGRLWHFGTILPYRVESILGEHSKLAVIGQNDVSDISNQSYCFMAVVDPQKIAGEQESSLSRGFGFNISDAEVCYIRFPRTNIELAASQFVVAEKVEDFGQQSFCVKLQTKLGALPSPYQIGFDYFFSKSDLRVLEVKFNTPTERTHKTLKSQHKINSTLDSKYLEHLKRSVEYWDGTKWTMRPSRILN